MENQKQKQKKKFLIVFTSELLFNECAEVLTELSKAYTVSTEILKKPEENEVVSKDSQLAQHELSSEIHGVTVFVQSDILSLSFKNIEIQDMVLIFKNKQDLICLLEHAENEVSALPV